MNNYYAYLKNSKHLDFFNISNLYLSNYSLMCNNSLVNFKLYKILNNYLENNNYLINIDSLFIYLKDYKLNYKSINQIPTTINYIITRKINSLIKDTINIYKEFDLIDNAIDSLNINKEYSINKYYSINENTSYIYLYYLKKRIIFYKNDKLLKTFNIIIDLYDNNINNINNSFNDYLNKYNTLANNLYYSLNFNNYDKLYYLVSLEEVLRDNSLFINLSNSTRNLYRYKLSILNKIPFMNINKIDINKLFKKSSTLLSLNNKHYDFNILIVINNKVNTFRDIDNIFNKINDNYNSNIYYFIKTTKKINNYYINKSSDFRNYITKYNISIIKSNNIKYVIELNENFIDKDYIYNLLNILEHPNNLAYINNNKIRGIYNIKFKYNNKYSYIFNYALCYSYFKKVNPNNIKHKYYKIKKNNYLIKDNNNDYFKNSIITNNKLSFLSYRYNTLINDNEILFNDLKYSFKYNNLVKDNFKVFYSDNILYSKYYDKNIDIEIKTTIINDSLISSIIVSNKLNKDLDISFNNKIHSNYINYKEEDNYINVNDKLFISLINSNINNINYDSVFNKYISYNTNIHVKHNNIYKFYNIISLNKESYSSIDTLFIKSKNNSNNNYSFNKLLELIINPINDYDKNSLLLYNSLDKKYLNKFNISLDNPYLLFDNYEECLIDEAFKFYNYSINNNYKVNLVFIYKDVNELKLINKYLYLNNISKDVITIIDRNTINNKELILLYLMSIYNISSSSLNDFINSLNYNNYKIDSIKSLPFNKNITYQKDNLIFSDNSLYFTDNNYYDNLLISNNMKSITSTNSSYTLYNDKLITSKDLYSEEILINNKRLIYNSFNINLGSTKRLFNSPNLDIEIEEALSELNNVKIFKVKIISKISQKCDVSFHIKPYMKDNRFLYSNFDKSNNLVTFKNDLDFFITSSSLIKSFDKDNNIINISCDLKENKEFITSFVLGISTGDDIWFLKEKYSNISTVLTSLKIFNNTTYFNLHKIDINTNNNSINNFVNFILPYNIYINDNIDKYQLSLVTNIFKDLALSEIKKYNIDVSYISLLYKYIYYYDDLSLINNELYEKLSSILFMEEDYDFKYYNAILDFISLSKIYDKNINTNKFKKLLDNYKDNNNNNDIHDLV